MKRINPWMSLLAILLLVSCTLPSRSRSDTPVVQTTATLSPIQVQTEISAMLTMMPSPTVEQENTGGDSTPTLVLPTVSVDDGTATQGAMPLPSSTPEAQAATATVEPPTPTPTASATAQPQGPTATIPAGDPRLRLGSATSTDPMDNSTKWVWPTGSDQYSSGSFTNGTQVITSLDELDGWRMANPVGREFSNIYLEATFKTNSCSGSDHYGIILRVPVVREPDQGYLFGITCDGRYSLRRWNSEVKPKGEMKRLVDWTASSAINAGANQTNRIGIYAVGSRLVMYINGNLMTEVQDSLYPSGYFGVFIGYDVTKNLSVQVDEMSYWENPQQ